MCLIALVIRASKFPLVIAANRDEDYSRPTVPASFWPDSTDVLGGRDAVQGGTWLAISRRGRFAAVTNLRGAPPDPRKRSRGELVREFMVSDVEPDDYLNDVASRIDQYAAFHLVAGDVNRVALLSGDVTALSDGVHALSNAPPGERWPKVKAAEIELKRLSSMGDANELVDAILDFLSASRGTDERENEVFVVHDRYGTRSSTAIVITADNRVLFAEQSFARGGVRDGETRRFSFSLSTV